MIYPDFHPFPELVTERLVLRRMIMNDATEVFFLRSDEDVIRYIGREPAKDIEEAKDFISQINHGIDANEAIMWAIALQTEPQQLIGTICLWQIRKEHHRAEVGFVLHPLYWRKGYMKEALTKVVEYSFNVLGLHSLDANVSDGNVASAAVLESVGFEKEGYLKENYFFRNKYSDTIVYGLLNKNDE